ncbi:MAG: DUF4062 domain-containing protein [Elusimicrobia bacterium]|nr:DUF4062 domain-containing protein [Elusimicrobiota bacterium]
MRIYLSSTSVDLKPYREAVLGALRRMGHDAAAMEDYGAEDQWPADKCVADVQSCQLYVGVFAWRYGFIPAGRQFSVTEMEYLAAREKGIPTLIFVLDPEIAWPPKFIDRGEKADRIEGLRGRLMNTHLVSLFSSPEDLAAKVATAVARAEGASGKAPQPAKGGPSWSLAEIRERAKKASEDYFEKMQRQRIFLPQVYVARADAESHLDGFSDPACSKTGMLLVGASGTGKTNTLCHWVRRFQENPARPKDVLLFLGGSTLPGGHFDLKQSILERLEVSGTMPEFLAAFASMRKDSDAQFIIVIDSVDKHPQPAELMRQIDDLIVLEEVLPWYKVIVSIAEIPYAKLRNDGFVPSARDYYAAPSPDGESLEVQIGLLNTKELSDAYMNYLKEPGFAPASTYGELTDEVRLSLRKPLVLRIVMELFHDRKVPDRVLGTEVLFEYCTKKIFRHPDRLFFVNRLVDFLYDNHATSASFDKIAREPDLRQALLDHSSESCYAHLLDEQVLEEQTKRVSSILPPQRSVAFTYDRLLEYLLLARLAERFGMRPDALLKLAKEAPAYLPLHGVLTTLLVTKAEENKAEEAAVVFQDGEPEVMRPLARRVFAELEHIRPMREGVPAREEPLGRLVEAMAKSHANFSVELLLGAAAELRKLGYLRRSASIYEELKPRAASLEPRLTVAYHRGRGLVNDELGHNAEALSEFQAALAVARSLKDRAAEQELLDDIGRIHLDLGDTKKALEALSASLAIDRELVAQSGGSAEAPPGEASSLWGLSRFHLLDGGAGAALEHAEGALKIRRELGDRRAVAESVLQLGRCQRRSGRAEDSLASVGEGLSIFREAGSKLGIAECLVELGYAQADLGKPAEASASLAEALARFKEIGSVERLAEVHSALGDQDRKAGLRDSALRHYVEALDLHRESGDDGPGGEVGRLRQMIAELRQPSAAGARTGAGAEGVPATR